MNSVYFFVFVQTEIVLLKIVLLTNFFGHWVVLGTQTLICEAYKSTSGSSRDLSSCLDESGHEAMLEFPNQLQTKFLIKSTNVASK